MAFKYRDSGVYEVAPGQIWSVGNHVFACEDVTTLRFPGVVKSVGEPDLLYSDPPWSDALVKSFRTLSDLPPADYPWQDIFEAIFRLPTKNGYWIVGDRYRQDELASMLPRPVQARWALPGFTTPRVLGVLHYSGDAPPPPGPDLSGLKDEKLPEAIMRRYSEPGLICEPCSGLGITSRCAERAGWRSVNNELSPIRVSAALRRMEKLIGQRPERIA